jgi:RNase P subunit RPR2
MSDDGTDWICYPCQSLFPNRDGRVTVHGNTDPEKLTVWCPWCGDKMQRAPWDKHNDA